VEINEGGICRCGQNERPGKGGGDERFLGVHGASARVTLHTGSAKDDASLGPSL
jgi:hypothetical protein